MNQEPQVVIPITPEAPGPTELDTATADFIKGIEAEYRAEDLTVAPAQEVAKEPPPSEITEPQTPVEPKAPDLTSEVSRVMWEEKLSAANREMETMRARMADLESRQIGEDISTETRLRPMETWKKMGLDPDAVIRAALAAKLGDKAPPELRQTIQQNETQLQIRALEQKIIAQNREMAAKQYFESVAAEAKAYVAKGISVAPLLAEVAKTNPDQVHREIMTELIQDARSRSAKEPNGAIMPYDEAAKRVEARLSEYKKLLGGPATPVVPQAGTTPPVAQQVASTKTQTTVIKPPDRPLAPWLQKVDVSEQGIKEALDEYKRVESGKPR